MSEEEKNVYSAREITLQKSYIRDMEELLDAEGDIMRLKANPSGPIRATSP
jgi:hypothetical protein